MLVGIALVKELEVFATVVEQVLNTVFEEVFRQIHVHFKVVKCHLRFDHPELGKVAGSVGVFCAERRSEGVDLSETHGT